MKWYVDGHEFEDARQAADYIMEGCDESYYDDLLDDCYGEIEICGYTYSASIALYRVDPVAYNCGRSDWEDFEAGEIEYDLERMSDGECDEFYGCKVLCEEDEEEEEEDEEEC